MSMTKNIIDTLKNQDIKVDSVQLSLIEALSKIKINKNFTDAIRRFTRDEDLGIYIWGDVGRGKTLIVNEFIKQLKDTNVKSFHYIDFMSFIHDELNKSSGKKDPLKNVSKNIANRCNIIFIDEFQVEDVADAMIVTNILERILNLGLKIIITSNAHPDDLYKDGLQRQKFIKSMQVCVRKLKIFNLNGDIDYRTKNIIDLDSNKKNIYSDKDISKLINDNFISHNDQSSEILVNERKFKCKFASSNLLWIDFMVFFKDATGSKDYKELSSKLDWIFISNFNKCDDDSIDIVRRFISFIDIVYTRKVKVKLFFNKIEIKELYMGTKLNILWSRCASRLIEMQSYDYFSKHKN
jgi:cell division protein ZapE